MKRSFNLCVVTHRFVTHRLRNAGLRPEFSKRLKVVSSGLVASRMCEKPRPFLIQGTGTNLSSALVTKAKAAHSLQIAA